MACADVQAAVAAVARGEPVVVFDHQSRENEGDLVMAAEAVTRETAAFFLRHTSGLLCVSITPERADALRLPPMAAVNSESNRTDFTVSVDWAAGTTTGISAADRARTARALADPASPSDGFARPGHVFPLRAKPGGVLERPGHTEAATDLVRSAGLSQAGLLCELVTPDKKGMARLAELRAFAALYRLPLISIADLVAYRCRTESLVCRVASARVPTGSGRFTAHVYQSTLDGAQHLVLTQGRAGERAEGPVHVHRECLMGDALGSLVCGCAAELRRDLARIDEQGRGVLVYLRGGAGSLGHGLGPQDAPDGGSRSRPVIADRDVVAQILEDLRQDDPMEGGDRRTGPGGRTVVAAG